jgi:glycosyltransferase involved in cell wall biosynthesis
MDFSGSTGLASRHSGRDASAVAADAVADREVPQANSSSQARRVPTSPLTAGQAKPRVLIMPNAASWIVGQMAMHIIRHFADRYEFWLFTDKTARLRPDLVRALLPSLDFIFPLTDKSYNLLRKAAHPSPLPPSLLWLHHVTTWNPSMREALRDSAEIIACTEGWREQIELQSEAGIPVTVVPHGVDPMALRRVASQRCLFAIPSDCFVVGFVGSKTSNYDEGRKGLDALHTILAAARSRIPNFHISFLGLGWEHEVRQLRSQGISANYVGFIPETQLAAFYSSIDAYLMTSRVEGGPCTVLEAMACQTPVVATRVGLVPEVITDGVTGFSAPVGDAPAMVSHLVQLASSPDLRERMGVAARAAVAPSRSWSETLRSLEQPLARMTLRSTRKSASATPASSRRATELIGAAHAVDGLLWGLMSWWQKLVNAPTAVRLVRSSWEGYTLRDVRRGLGLITRLSFRPATTQKLLHRAADPAPALSFSERSAKSYESSCP